MDKKSSGFTLVELIVVITILGILAAVAVPRLAGFRSMAEESVCVANRKTVERMYSAFLVEKDIDHENSLFDQFVIDNFDEVCPSGGVISFEDGKNASAISCIISNEWKLPVRREYGERTKTTICSISRNFNHNILHKW